MGNLRQRESKGASHRGGHAVEAQRTQDHELIQEWAEERGGHPAVVEGTEILRIDFDEPGGDNDAKLERVSWDEFFEVFDDRGLQFLYQDQTSDGKESRFNKFVRGDSNDDEEED
jgi:hypothetical protein